MSRPQIQKTTHTTHWIPVKDISVLWANTQRSLRDGKVAKIAKAFDPDVFGVVLVAKPNGRNEYHCIDGQHRIEAVRTLFGDSERVPCYVAQADNPSEAADVFLRVNGYGGTRTSPNRIDQFRVAVTAGYEAENEVNDLLKEMGYRVGNGVEDGTLAAVGACMKIYHRYGLNHLRQVLEVIQATFGKPYESVHGSLLEGYAIALADKEINQGKLVKNVSKNYAASQLLGAGKTMRDALRSSLAEGVAEVLRTAHGKTIRRTKHAA